MSSAVWIVPYDTTGCPETELHQGTSYLLAWYNKFEVPEEDFRFLFFLLYIIIRCSISALCKAFENYVLRHVLRISDLREKKQKVYKKMLEVFGRYVVKQYFCTRFRERNADELKCWTKLGNTDFHFEKKLFRKKLQKSFGGSKISLTFASAFLKKAVKEKSSLKDLDINKQVVQKAY